MSATAPLATIPWSDLKEGKRLGQGAYGVVHLGEWEGRTVAIKKLILDTLTERLAKEFRKEAEVMWRCGESPHIVKMLGICTEETHPALVLEYMPKGSLYDLLSNEELELTWPLRFRIARDIGKGLSYLHDHEIVHRDLKSPNILLDADMNAKLSDFGLAKVRFATESKLQSMNTAAKLVGTLNWLAPELFTLEPVYTKESDVYAYAIVLYEIASRKIPYAGARVNIEEYVKKGERPTLPEVTPIPYAELTHRAWHQKPQERPGIRYLVLKIEEIWQLPSAPASLFPRPVTIVHPVIPTSPQLAPAFTPTKPLRPTTVVPPVVPASPQLEPASEPTIQTLQDLILQLLALAEMKNYAHLTTLLQNYLGLLFEEKEGKALEGNKLKVYRLAQKMSNKIEPLLVPVLEMALAPQGNPPLPSPAPVAKSALTLAPVLAPALVRAPVLPAIPAMAFGKAQWERFFGDVGVEPALPPNIDQILDSPCPFWSGKKVRETHLLTLIPQTVGGQPLTLNRLEELIQHPKQGTATKYESHWDKLKTQYGAQPVGTAHWVLMTRDVIPGSRMKSYEEQQQLIAKVGKGYAVPTLIDATATILMAYFAKGERLYGKSPWTYTRCQEEVDGYQSILGGFGPSGLFVSYYIGGGLDSNGVAASWKF